MLERFSFRKKPLEKKEEKTYEKKAVVALTGKESIKNICVSGFGTTQTKVIPFVGADDATEYANFGVGVRLPEHDQSFVWGLAGPHKLIQSWRAMKIIENVDNIKDHTLAHAWFSAEKKIHESDLHCLFNLSNQEGVEKFAGIRNDALKAVPTDKEIETMVLTLRDNKIEVVDWELKEEIAAGKIQETPIIKTVFEASEKNRKELENRIEEYKLQEEERKKAYQRLPKYKKALIYLGDKLLPKEEEDW